MHNAHPVILYFLCQTDLKIKVPNLNRYILNREGIINNLLSNEKFNNKQFDYDGVKIAFLALINGGSTEFDKLDKASWMHEFKNEITRIHDAFADKYPDLLESVTKSRRESGCDYNHKAALMNHLLCDFENKILHVMITHLKKNEIIKDNFVCCFDGIMIPKQIVTDLNTLIGELQKAIEKKLKIKIQIKEKNMIKFDKELFKKCMDEFNKQVEIQESMKGAEEGYIIGDDDYVDDYDDCIDEDRMLDDYQETGDEVRIVDNLNNNDSKVVNRFNFDDPYTYYEFRSAFNGRHFKSRDHMLRKILKKFPHVVACVNRDDGFYIKKMSDMINITKKLGLSDFYMTYDGKYRIEKTKFSDCLSQTNGFENVVCKMDTSKPCNEKFFNIWRGFKAKRVNLNELSDEIKEGFELMKTFVMEVWSNNNEMYYNYIISWMSGLFTKLDDINGVALAMISKQGTGKNTFTDFIRKYILGDHLVFDGNGINEIVQKHNDIVEGKRMIIVNEMASTKEEFISNFDRIKPYITENKISIEPKGLKRNIIDNIGNYIIFTNHRDSIIVSESDRRYAVFETSEIHINDTVYFDNLRKKCFNQDVGNAFYTYLLDFDAINVRIIPKTDLRDELQELSKPNMTRFIESYLEELTERKNDNNFNIDDIDKVRCSDLYHSYKNWCNLNGEKNIISNTKFGINIKQFKQISKIKTHGLFYYKFGTEHA
jgi:hypothetical protein